MRPCRIGIGLSTLAVIANTNRIPGLPAPVPKRAATLLASKPPLGTADIVELAQADEVRVLGPETPLVIPIVQ